jgi:hypothetical protein
MADSWTIVDGDRDSVTLSIVVGSTTNALEVSIEQLKPIANQADALTKLRAIATNYRNAVIARTTRPAAVQSAIGYTEGFV